MRRAGWVVLAIAFLFLLLLATLLRGLPSCADLPDAGGYCWAGAA